MQFTSVLLAYTVLHITASQYKNLTTVFFFYLYITAHSLTANFAPVLTRSNHCWSPLTEIRYYNGRFSISMISQILTTYIRSTCLYVYIQNDDDDFMIKKYEIVIIIIVIIVTINNH